MSEKIKLVALDLDGTLLQSDHTLSERSIEVLRGIASKGVIVCIATGRDTKSVHGYIKQLSLPYASPCVTFNGTCAVRLSPREPGPEEEEKGSDCKQLFLDPLSSEDAGELVALSEKLGLVAQYYNALTSDIQAVPTTDEHRELMRRYEGLVGHPQMLCGNYSEAAGRSPAAKMLLLTRDPDALMQTVQEQYGVDRFHMIRGSPDPFFVEFLRPGVCKGAGLKKLCATLGVPMDNVAAFGDGDNDKEMLQWAGLGVAMQNARDVTKAAADVVLELTNDQHGVAEFLLQLDRDGRLAYS